MSPEYGSGKSALFGWINEGLALFRLMLPHLALQKAPVFSISDKNTSSGTIFADD